MRDNGILVKRILVDYVKRSDKHQTLYIFNRIYKIRTISLNTKRKTHFSLFRLVNYDYSKKE